MRRLAFSCGALAALLSGCTLYEIEEAVDDMKVVTRIGVIANTDIGMKSKTDLLGKALRFYRQEEVDAVVVTGDITEGGIAESRERLDEVWNSVFEGQDVRLIAEDGKAEVKGFSFAVDSGRPRGKRDVLTFYGGRRLALTDELCFYPRDSRLICAGSMHGVEVPEAVADPELIARTKQAAQGLLVSVYSDKTVIRRLDFTQKKPVDRDKAWLVRKMREVYAEDVADPWVLAPDGTAERETAEVPEFWPDTCIRVLPGYLKGEKVCTVKWPSVLKRGTGVRARWYEVGVSFADDPKRVIRSRTVMSGSFFLSEDRDLKGVQTVFRLAELPRADATHSQAVFSVTPVGAYGKRGKAFYSEPVSLRQE